MLKTIFVFLLLMLSHTVLANANEWRELAKGLDYVTLYYPNGEYSAGKLHAFRIDLNLYQMNFIFAKDQQQDRAYISELALQAKAIVAINGGFFSLDSKPLGLRIQDGQVRNPLRKVSWGAVFYVENNKPYIVASRNYSYNKDMQFAVQGGPRLVIDGRLPNLKEGTAERTALGITEEGKVIILVTDDTPMTTTAVANLMKQSESHGGLGCQDAMNLDGGTSTQLYAKVGSFRLHVPNFKPVTDAIIIIPLYN